MQLILHVTCRTPHGASRLVQAQSVWSVKTHVLRPGIAVMRGSMVIRHRPCMISSTPPTPPPYLRCLFHEASLLVENVVSQEVDHVEVWLCFVHQLLAEHLSNQTGQVLVEKLFVLRKRNDWGVSFERNSKGGGKWLAKYKQIGRLS